MVGLRVAVLTKPSLYNLDRTDKRKSEREREKKRDRDR
jgi:hypothetical protein